MKETMTTNPKEKLTTYFHNKVVMEGWTCSWVLSPTWIELFGLYVIGQKGKKFCPWRFAMQLLSFGLITFESVPT
jgi:hypothetical protein